MTKQTIEQVKATAADFLLDTGSIAEDIKRLSSLVNFNLTREQIAFAIAATHDDMSDANWIDLLTEAYTGTEQSVIDKAHELTGFDGTDEDRTSMQVYIDAFAAAHDGRWPNLSPNALWAVLTDEDNQKEYDTIEEWISCIEEAEPEETSAETDAVREAATETAEKSKQTAFTIADELAKDAEALGVMTKAADNAQFLRIAPLMLMQKLEGRFGGDAMLGWPIPGSSHPQGLAAEGNILFDKHKVPRPGKKTKMAVSFYGIIFDRLPDGRDIAQKQADIALAETGPYKTSPSTGWTASKREAEKSTLAMRRNNQIKNLGAAVSLHQQIAWLKDYPNLSLRYNTDIHGNLNRTVAPFILTPTVNGEPNIEFATAYTVAEVLRFNREQAYAKGGTWDSLTDTLKRVPSEAEKEAELKKAREIVDAAIKAGKMKADGTLAPTAQAVEVGLIKNIAQAESYIAMVAHFGRDMMEKEHGEPMVKDFAKELSTNKGFALSCRDLVRFADSIRGRVETLSRKIEAEELQAKGNGTQAKTA